MQRITTPTHAVDLFGPGKHGFKDGNLALGIVPTDFNAAWPNGLQEEIANVIESAGIALDGAVLTQLRSALVALYGRGRLLGIQVIAATGTYTKTTGTMKGLVILDGAGGGGGGTNATGAGQCSVGSGGGGGGWALKLCDLSAVNTVACTIGTAGASAPNAGGTTGGTTAFGAFCSATGGAGGSLQPATSISPPFQTGGAGGGGGIGGDINGQGFPGGQGFVGALALGGAGGGSVFGGGAAPSSSAGNNGTSPGSGGSGGAVGASGAAVAGGAGPAGRILVLEFS